MTIRVTALCRAVFICVLALTLAACSATNTRIKGYQGADLPEAETATLNAPETIRVLSINGEKAASFLLTDFALSFALRPGDNNVVFQYRSIWAKKGVRENGDSAVETVNSEPVEVSFEAEAGATYTFMLNEPGNVREARQFASDFSAALVTGSGAVVAQSTAYEPQPRAVATSGPVLTNQGVVGQTDAASESPAASGLSTLDALNLLWKRATREEKEAFLQQAFD